MAERRGEIASQLFAAAQPLMEIATEEPVSVTNAAEASSYGTELIGKLRAGTRLSVVETFFDADGGRRALVVLKGGAAPLGWISLANPADGSPVLRAVHARPLYEVIKPPIVRRRCDLASEEVCRLAVGERLHVIDVRRTSDGARRVCVVRVGEDDVLGWITARRPDSGKATIRVLREDEDEEDEEEEELVVVAGRETGRSSPSTPSGAGASTASRPVSLCMYSSTSRISQPAAPLPAFYSSCPWPVHAISRLSPPSRCSPGPPSARQSADRHSSRRRGSAGVPPVESDGQPQPPQPTTQAAVGAADVQKSQKKPIPLAVRAQDARARPSSAPVEVRMVSASAADEVAAAYERRASELEDSLDESKKSVAVRLGEALVARQVNVRDLVRQWCKRGGEEPISKMEFRQKVRNFVETPAIKAPVPQIDQLFESLDEDRGGSLDPVEMRAALKKLQDAAAEAKSSASAVIARAGLLRDRAAAARKAAEATLACESAEEEILRLKSNSSLDARLGALLAAKAMKISELVAKWDESGDGVIDKEEYAR
jgi:hypothetical protein